MKNSPILIIGKNGKTGARVNQRLQALGYETRAVSRSTTPSFDWEDSATWASAIKGTRSAYVTYQPDLAVPNAEAAIKEFIRVARENGLEHIVLLSGRGEEGAQRAEQVLKDSGISWNIVRCSWFNQNFSEGAFVEMVQAGLITLPAADTPEPFVDVDDIADVAVAALTDDGHAGEIYEVTGPRLLTFADISAEISRASGRSIAYVEVPHDAFVAGAAESGAPKDVIWMLDYLFATVLDGRNAFLTDGVERALGRAPKDFSDYAREIAATDVWKAVA